jgi:hypothetical protein
VGLFVSGSNGLVESTVVCDILPDSNGRFGRGICVQDNPATGNLGTVTLRGSLVEHNHEIALFVGDSDATVQSTVLRDTVPSPTWGHGDGLVIISLSASRASARLSDSLVQANARAGIASFGSAVTLTHAAFDCNPIHLNGEREYDLPGEEPLSQAYDFDDQGRNECGCGQQTEACTVLSAGLEPPAPTGHSAAPQ